MHHRIKDVLTEIEPPISNAFATFRSRSRPGGNP